MASVIKITAKDHPIKSVTVFKSSKAEVVRTFSIELKAGQNKVEVRGLPSTIDTQSVRVSGLGEARLFDVVCTIGNASQEDPHSPTEVIRLLKVRKAKLESEKRVREHEAGFLVNYAKTLTGEHIDPKAMSQFLEDFVAQGRDNLNAVTTLDEQIIDVDRQIEKETANSAALKGHTHGQATVVIGTEERSAIELQLTYIVSNASWEPTYELHATTANGKPASSVSLHYRARINQSTGEDWSNTSLTLSTVASDTFAKSIPRLRPLKIQLQVGGFKGFSNNNVQQQLQQQQLPQQQRSLFTQGNSLFQQQQAPQPSTSIFGQPSFGAASTSAAVPSSTTAFGGFGTSVGSLFGGSAAAGTSGSFGSAAATAPTTSADSDAVEDPANSFEEILVPGPFSEPHTVVSETPLAISYSVEGKSTVPSDGVAHQVPVAVLPFEGKVTYVTVPRIEPRVYLQCEVKNTSEYRLLPGVITIILDDSFVSKTSIHDINTGDRFNCTLGADSATKVSYSRTFRTVRSNTGAFAEGSNTTTYKSKIVIHNKHLFAISDLIVCDVIPMCDDKRVKVILRKPEGLAEAKDGKVLDMKDGQKVKWSSLVDGKGGEKEGKFEWLWKVEPGAQVNLEAEWEVKAPGDTTWIETFANFGQ